MTAGAGTTVARIDALLGRPVSMRSLALVRMLVGAVAFAHLWPIASAALRGDTFDDRFHHPYITALAELPTGLHVALLTIGLVAAAATAVGALSRIATATTFTIVAYHLLLSTTHVHNNRVYLAIVLGLLAAAPVDRAFSIDEAVRRRRGTPRGDEPSPAWPLWLLRFECAAVYAASGFSKLIDPDWMTGDVTWLRVQTNADQVHSSPLPGFAAELLLDPTFHVWAAPVVVLTELVIAVGLWWPRARRLIIPLAVTFHIAIEIGAEVQLFSYLAIAVLVVWSDPDLPWLRLPRIRPAAARVPNVTP